MEKRTTLTEKVLALDKSLAAEDILLPIDYNLTPTAIRRRVDGIAVLTKDRFLVYANGAETASVPLSEVEEAVFRQGNGCCFIEYRLKSGEWHIIIRLFEIIF